MSIAALVLAAGPSSRLGQAKQLVVHRGRPLLRAAAEEALASACDRVVAVLGAREREVRLALEGLAVDVVANPAWEEGIASSIRCGAAWAAREGYTAAVLMVCDQPALTASHLDRLIGAYRAGATIAASGYAGSLGVPAIFDRALFPALLALRGNEGAKRVLHSRDAVTIDWPDGSLDVDTPGDVALLAP